METEEEISPETNAEVDENLTEDPVEIDLEDEDLTELLGLEEEELLFQRVQLCGCQWIVFLMKFSQYL